MKVMKKTLSVILAVLLIIGYFDISAIDSYAESGTCIIKASTILENPTTDDYVYNKARNSLTIYDGYSNMVLYMDTDLELSTINDVSRNKMKFQYVTLKITGSKKLTIDSKMSINCNLILDKGTDVTIKNGRMIVSNELTVEENAKLYVNSTTSLESNKEFPTVYVMGKVESFGNITVNTDSYGIAGMSYFYISNGTINVNADNEGIYAQDKLYITGGNIYVNVAKNVGIVCRDGYLDISGGYIESTVGDTTKRTGNTLKYGPNIFSPSSNGVDIKSPMYIKYPTSAAVKDMSFNYPDLEITKISTILDSNGNIPKKIIISNREVDKKAEEEAAAKKAAEEAAKKKAEEEAKKKAAEEAAKKNNTSNNQNSSSATQNAETVKPSALKQNLQVVDKKSGGKYKLTKVTKKNGKVVGGTVTYMAPNNKNCTKATTPDCVMIAGIKFKVTEINKNAFKNCKKLTKVTIGKNITKIGAGAFSGCSKLKSISIRTTKLKSIGKNAFKGINSKARFKVPKKRYSKYKKMIKSAKAPKTAKITK